MTASVYLKPDQVSLAIGKGGLNIRLSKMLTCLLYTSRCV